MPKEKINGIDLFYLLEGEGEEVLLILNGIMMSTASWIDIMPAYQKHFRTLRVDFRNQGLSTFVNEDFAIDVHVDDLYELLKRLNIEKVNILGISYGGEVAMLFALKYQHMVKSLVLSNTTARVTNHLRCIADSWDEAAKLYDGTRFFKLVMPNIYSAYFYEHNLQWLKDREQLFGKILKKEWFDAYMKLSGSTFAYDILDRLHEIEVPTICIASDLDIITPVSEVRLIHERIKNSGFVIMADAGHASFYEKPDEFNAIALGFLLAVVK